MIPAVATVTGLAAWALASGTSELNEEITALVPDSEYPPVTVQVLLPSLPSLYDETSNLELLGVADCIQDSKRSARAMGCEVEDELLDPCYWPPGDVGIPYVFCFDVQAYAYKVFEVGELVEVESLWESLPVDYIIYVEYPTQDNLADYPEELVDTYNGTYDICVIDDYQVEAAIDRSYSCLTGSKVSGAILGSRPHNFVEYTEADSGETTSQWLGFIVYG